ncbi:MAG TPA: serine hydrolase domain-containing protein [Longimicrobiales bacterium]|nr:serine hydrolase domain-containing protein [Longimicrobiales bacterium]
MITSRRTPRAFVVLTLLVLGVPGLSAQALPMAAPEAVGMSAERLARLDRTLDAYVEADQLAGGVVMIARRGRLAHQYAFGLRDVESGDPMELDDLFRIASQSKAVVSVAAMVLVEEGRLLLNDPVSRFLPAFEATTVETEDGAVVPADRRVTVRDLLTHTAGVDYGMGREAWEAAGVTGWYFADRTEPIGSTASRMAELPFRSQPGERWVYGYSTDILGAVLEVASGMPLDRLLRDRILDPLGMDDTWFYVPPAEADRLVTVYGSGEAGIRRAPDGPGMRTQGNYLEGPRASFSGGAGLVSTAGDYARFLQMLLNGGELDGARVLSPASVDLMTRNHTGDLFRGPAYGFGLGFEILQDPGAAAQYGDPGAYGWGGAYHSTYWVDPAQELVVVYMTQLIPARVDDHARLRPLVYQAVVEAGGR